MSPWIRRGLGGLAGLTLGALVGFYLTVVVFVAKARAGIYVFSLDDVTALRWEMIPTFCGVVAGVAIGCRDVGLLGGLGLSGALVSLPFGLAGWFIGGFLWATSSGRWAGAVIGVGVGLLVGIGGEAIRRGLAAEAPEET